jgi:hypothetical protein
MTMTHILSTKMTTEQTDKQTHTHTLSKKRITEHINKHEQKIKKASGTWDGDFILNYPHTCKLNGPNTETFFTVNRYSTIQRC